VVGLTNGNGELQLWDPEQGPLQGDIHQSLQSCWIHCALAGVVSSHPEQITNMVRRSTSTPGFFEVDMFINGKKETVVVDERFHPEANFATQYIWPQIIEKAIVKYVGGYKFVNKGNCNKALSLITGQFFEKLEWAGLDANKLESYLSKNYIVVAELKTKPDLHILNVYRCDSRNEIVYLFDCNSVADYESFRRVNSGNVSTPNGSKQCKTETDSGLIRGCVQMSFENFKIQLQDNSLSLIICYYGRYERIKRLPGCTPRKTKSADGKDVNECYKITIDAKTYAPESCVIEMFTGNTKHRNPVQKCQRISVKKEDGQYDPDNSVEWTMHNYQMFVKMVKPNAWIDDPKGGTPDQRIVAMSVYVDRESSLNRDDVKIEIGNF